MIQFDLTDIFQMGRSHQLDYPYRHPVAILQSYTQLHIGL